MISREQFLTVAWLRWRAFNNRLRSTRAKAEAISGGFMFFLMLLFGLGPAIGFAFGSYFAITGSDPRLLSVFLWITFLYWQFFPTVALAVTEVFDTASFLRFPVSLSTYYALWLAFGSLDPSLVIPVLWLLGIFLGVAVAAPALLPWTVLVLFTFTLLNLLLSRMIIAYVERWMAQRKTREIVGALIGVFGIGIQLISRLIGRFAPHNLHSPVYRYLSAFEANLPPGAAARALAHPNGPLSASAHWLILIAYCIAFGAILALRLRGQYRGENFSETSAKRAPEKRVAPASRGWLALPDPIGAIFEKELRTLFGIRQIWIVLLAPPIMLVIFGTMGSGSNLIVRSPWALPAGAAYGLLSMSSFFCNCFSSELAGIQLLYLAPVRFRQIFLAKNLAYTLLCVLQFLLLLGIISFFSVPPAPSLVALTTAALAFALLANFAAGNLLSLYFPRKIDFSRMNRQGSSATGLFMLGLQIVTVGLAAPVFFLARYYGSNWLAASIFLVLAAIALIAYRAILANIDSVALSRRESLIAEMTKTS